MKHLLLVLLFVLSACVPPTQIPPTETSVPPTSTSTETIIPPTETLAPPTITVTKTATRTPTKLPPTSPSTPSGDVFWFGDAETGDKSQWCKQTSQTEDRVTVVTDPVNQGNFAYRFELRANDSPSGERATLANGQCASGNKWIREGDEAYYGFSVFLPEDYPSYPQWSLLVQWKGEHTGSPPAQCSLRDDHWQFTYRPPSSANMVKWRSPEPANRGQWEHFVLHAKWSPDPEVGFYEYWYNGTLVVPKFHTATMHPNGTGIAPNFVAIGLYRDSGIDFDVFLYHDGFTSGNSLEAVAPWLK